MGSNESNDIMDADVLSMEEMQVLRSHKKELSYEEQCSMNKAYMKATFGDEIVKNIGDNHEAITNTKFK